MNLKIGYFADSMTRTISPGLSDLWSIVGRERREDVERPPAAGVFERDDGELVKDVKEGIRESWRPTGRADG